METGKKKRKGSIFGERRGFKKEARRVLLSHYPVLTFLTLIMILFGTEFRMTNVGMGNISMLERAGKAVMDLIPGENSDVTMENPDASQGSSKAARMLGRDRGVLARMVNTLGFGRARTNFRNAMQRITGSEMAAAIATSLILLFGYLAVFFLFRNIYSAVLRRIFLQARVYEKVSFLDVSFFAAVRSWFKAAKVMMVESIFMFLWNLTVIGGIIKHYSYFCVPYIVAENPSVGAREAISLSRRMMYGYKKDLFLYELSLVGWVLLGFLTVGFSDMVYGTPYRIAAFSEFYARIRQKALEDELEGTELLNDPYLFEKADRILLYETYFEVVDEITLLHENRITLTGVPRFFAEWFGIWLGRSSDKRRFDDQEGRLHAVEGCRESMLGIAYPKWLSPLWDSNRKRVDKVGHFSPLRAYSVWTLFLLFIIFSFIGWSWEVILHLVQTGELANRGALHGPWLPIYGTGGIIALLLCNRFRKKPVLEFAVATVLCGCLEYYISWFLENKYHQKWWSYDGYFLNLNGRICAEGLLIFGAGCCAVVYLAAPVFDYLLSKIKISVIIGICAVIAVVYGTDAIYSDSHPNMAKGAIESAETEPGSEDALFEQQGLQEQTGM